MYTEEELKVIAKELCFIPIDESYSEAYDICARCTLGAYYTNKNKNLDKAIENYTECINAYKNNVNPYPLEIRESVKKTYYNACYSLGVIYYLGDNIADPSLEHGEQGIVNVCQENADIEKAIKYLKEAADDGKDLDASYYLGCLYLSKKDVKGISYLQYAAKNGNAYAQNTLGRCYEFGILVTKSIKKALRWYRRAAYNGDILAKGNLSRHKWW